MSRLKIKLGNFNIPLLASIGIFLLLFLAGSVMYPSFLSLRVVLNLFINNAHLIVLACGICFPILTGGIDLSVGAVIAMTSMIAAALLQKGLNAFIVIVLCLLIGIVFGTVQGFLIQYFKMHPWIVTLAGMFFARGVCYLISIESIPITDDTFYKLSQFKIYLLPGYFISLNVLIAIVFVLACIYVSKYTQFGRTVFAIGGNMQSAILMGLPVDRTRIMIYSLSGFGSSLAGVMFSFYTLSGYGLHAQGLEMDAIAACVIGGVLLTGGVGSLIGPVIGVLITGVIRTMVDFQGTLSSWWTKIFVGLLMLLCIVMQVAIVNRGKRTKDKKKTKEETIDESIDVVV
ncbi:sugar ABC transporter permease YjfF [Enterococcus hulanensis]|uniref:Sugar ABC transporter permease YjfF n=1 Tax=Enterococcus hulanensis TaxID=2559929 RepID=A0ABU3F4X7_9ENTE|nr:galactofuranose ABC transporter, permease protein YjfF [Enterococcus hulanensis]MDT2602183.1 sugar ABC transporter permease YjfF [Enterococcus hulanensis]MDT2611578.1 sugar ABC transporter permease YjfF [Enterococcus hulanensis]MDT2618843.1 sugar ABC transporter permease YjfF [Enterococcus hulanensis]MDT2630255.1 sugar ABC transporter permease YjfF [Enterococcus hulanensis]MDT2657832.1 sugar ABC transporter permease YjfF [Enterococcus hulanensis]